MRTTRARTLAAALAVAAVAAPACTVPGTGPTTSTSTGPAPTTTAGPAPTTRPTTTSRPPAATTTTHDHGGGGGGTGGGNGLPFVDLGRIPDGHDGYSQTRIRATDEAPVRAGDGVGAFRSVCGYSHMNQDDAILFPNRPGGSAHLHTYFGQTAADANATSPAQLRAPGSAGTCRGGSANLSAYWIPTLVDTRDGRPVRPTDGMDVYYKSGYGGVAPGQIKPLPKGVRLLAGDAKAQGDQGRQVGQWGCSTETQYQYHGAIPACPAGAELSLEVDFPQCLAVDGSGRPLLDSEDHRRHAAYPNRGCPASHPYAIPAITFVIHWPVPAGTDSSRLRLTSDSYAGGAGGHSRHGDYIEGWDDAVRDQFVRNCTAAAMDCHSHLLGRGPDGRYQEIY